MVPTAVWKAIYDPRAQATGSWLCSNTDRPACQVLGIDALTGQVGIDPFPGLPATAKARLLPLRLPDDGAGGSRRPVQPRREYGLIGWLSWEADATWTAPCSPTPAPQCGRAGGLDGDHRPKREKVT